MFCHLFIAQLLSILISDYNLQSFINNSILKTNRVDLPQFGEDVVSVKIKAL